MPNYLAQITLQGQSGAPDDIYTNAWSFFDASDPISDPNLVLYDAAFIQFYTQIKNGQTAALYSQMGEQVAENGHSLRYYNRDDAPPRIPFRSTGFDFPSAPTGPSLPAEVAICLSFRGEVVPGTNVGPGPHLPARRRGRIYFGPLASGVGFFDLNDLRPTTVVRDNLLDGLEAMADECDAAGGFLGVYSTPNDDTDRIEFAWVDNAFDTQRRRGAAPSSRMTKVVFP
jgi:hypothetical protein